MTNTQELIAIIDAKGLKRSYIAQQMGISTYALALKMRNDNEFLASEIDKLCEILDIKSLTKRQSIFFYKPSRI